MKKAVTLILGFLLLTIPFAYATEGDLVTNWSTTAANSDAWGVASNETYLWVSDWAGKAVYRYDLNGAYTGVSWSASAVPAPRGICSNGSDSWIVSYTEGVYHFTSNGTFLDSWTPTGVSGPISCATDNINIWVADLNEGSQIYKYTMTGSSVSNFDTSTAGMSAIRGITTDGNFIWAIDTDDNAVYKFNMSGTWQLNWSLSPAPSPQGIGVSADGSRIWAAQGGAGDAVYEYEGIGLPDTTPPVISYYNVTNENGCENWFTDKTNACSTSSVVPTIQFNTNENAWCAIAGSSSSTSLDLNYTNMGSPRNCTGAPSGEGGTLNHRCTLIYQDELVYDISYLFISCKDTNGNQNRTSTSGALKLSITGLEAAGRNSIALGIQNALLSGYTEYTDLQIYARNLSNGQAKGTFDRAAKKSSKMWAFNRIGVSDNYVRMFNMTPVLYTLEFANKTSEYITNQTERLVNATK